MRIRFVDEDGMKEHLLSRSRGTSPDTILTRPKTSAIGDRMFNSSQLTITSPAVSVVDFSSHYLPSHVTDPCTPY